MNASKAKEAGFFVLGQENQVKNRGRISTLAKKKEQTLICQHQQDWKSAKQVQDDKKKQL